MTAFFSKILVVFWTFMAIFLPARPDNVKVKEIPVTTESTAIVFECENNTRRIIDRPGVASIEKKDENGNWHKLNINYIFTEEYYAIYPGKSAVDSASMVDESFDAYKLQKGEYRITVTYVLHGENVTGSASGEFTVSE